MININPQVKAKIDEITDDVSLIFHQFTVLTDFVELRGDNENDPTILELINLYYYHSDVILEYFIEKYRASK